VNIYKELNSDIGMKIHGGFPEADYDEAYDPIDMGRTYTETDIPIEEATAEEILDILTGEAE
jgi:hypothetical protein